MGKKTNNPEGLPKKGMRVVTFTLAVIYFLFFLVMSLVGFPGGNGETILVHMLRSFVG